MTTRGLLLSSAATLALLYANNEAIAQCAPVPVAGGTVTCSNVDNVGVNSAVDNLSVVVNNGATVSTVGNAIELNGTGAQTVTNNGAVTSSAGGIAIGVTAQAGGTGSGISIDTSSGSVTSDFVGVETDNQGSGDTTITTGTVNASAGSFGINANNANTAGALTIYPLTTSQFQHRHLVE